nr:hypothetical protein [Providencia stuartii]ELR5083475.1 hypothetical protein [Providencia stuartii]
MTDMNLITNLPRNFQMRSDFQSLVNANMKSDFFEGDDYVFKPNLNSVEQGKSVLDHYETKLKYEKVATPEELAGTPEKLKDRVWQQLNTPIDVLLQSSMPAGLSDQQQAEWISDLIRSSERESNSSSDKYNAAMSSLSKSVIEDGRPHITGIYELINNINNNYQKNFGEITKKATEFMEALNSALGKMSKNIKAAPNGEINLHKDYIFNDLNDAMKSFYKESKYQSIKDGDNNAFEVGYTKILDNIYTGGSPNFNIDKDKLFEYMEPMNSFDSSEGALQFWEKKLNGQGFIVVEKNNKIHIYPDMSPVKVIYTSVRAITGNEFGEVNVLTQVFQSLQTGIDTQKNAVNNSVSRLLETFRQDNSHFETLTQLLIQLLKDLFQYNAGFANT